MKKFLIVSAIYALGLGNSQATVQIFPDKVPSEVLFRAVSLTKACSHTVTKVGLDEKGEPKGTLEVMDNSGVSKLSLGSIFQPGRFYLEPVVERRFVGGRPTLVVRFSPQGPRKQLKVLTGEDEDYMKTINNLKGSVYVDPLRGSIIGVDANLQKPLTFKWKSVHLEGLHVSFQEETPESPRKIEVDMEGWAGYLLPVYSFHDRYTSTFSCENSKKNPPADTGGFVF